MHLLGQQESSWLWASCSIGHSTGFDAFRIHSKESSRPQGISWCKRTLTVGIELQAAVGFATLLAHEGFALRTASGLRGPPELATRIHDRLQRSASRDHFFVEPHPIAENRNGDKTTLKAFFTGTFYVIKDS